MNISSRESGIGLRIETSANPAQEAGKYLSDLLFLYSGKPVLFLLAGGSAMAVLDHVKPESLSPDVTVTMTDDRFSDELDVNNFAVLQSLPFYNSLVEADAFCINTQPNEGETLEEYRARFEKNIVEWKQDFPKGIIIALYGMGPDGHTGGMIPGVYDAGKFSEEFDSADRLVGTLDAVEAGKPDANPHPQRISTTLSFMREWVDHAAFYITGEGKSAMLKRASMGAGPYSDVPASVMTRMKDVVVFTDIVGF